MPAITGTFNNGCPQVELEIGGPVQGTPTRKFSAIVDTGFSGFIMMPLVQAFPLALALYGTAGFQLADGKVQNKLLAAGYANICGSTQYGIIALDETANDILLGIDLLTKFGLLFAIQPGGFVLIPRNELPAFPLLPPP